MSPPLWVWVWFVQCFLFCFVSRKPPSGTWSLLLGFLASERQLSTCLYLLCVGATCSHHRTRLFCIGAGNGTQMHVRAVCTLPTNLFFNTDKILSLQLMVVWRRMTPPRGTSCLNDGSTVSARIRGWGLTEGDASLGVVHWRPSFALSACYLRTRM